MNPWARFHPDNLAAQFNTIFIQENEDEETEVDKIPNHIIMISLFIKPVTYENTEVANQISLFIPSDVSPASDGVNSLQVPNDLQLKVTIHVC